MIQLFHDFKTLAAMMLIAVGLTSCLDISVPVAANDRTTGGSETTGNTETSDTETRDEDTTSDASRTGSGSRNSASSAQYRDLMSSPTPSVYEVPVKDVRRRDLRDTWGAARDGGRSHEGIDIFAKRNHPVISATRGIIIRQDTTPRGGVVVWIQGPGAQRHYYAHLESWSTHQVGDWVDPGETIGYVGNSGNAITTPTHLHYGIYADTGAVNPYPLLRD